MADTPSTVTLIDGTGQPVAFLATTNGQGQKTIQSTPRLGDAPVGSENPLPVVTAGRIGVDYSANAVAVPGNVSYVLLAIIPANADRASFVIRNQNRALLQEL